MSVTVLFNDAINGRDLGRLAGLMADEHTFVDSAGGVVSGKRACLDAWRGFFAAFPDYRNVFTSLTARGEVVAVAGYSVCSEEALDGPALWEVTVGDGRVVTWRVLEDTLENRRLIGVPDASGK